MKTINFIWSDYDLCIFPEVPQLKEELLTEFRRETSGPFSETTYEKEEAFNILNPNSSCPIIQTYAGFLDEAVKFALQRKYKINIVDKRNAFPKPQWELSSGFRLNQEQLLRLGIGKDRSGLIEAPTRYGKTTLIINTLRIYPNVPTIVTAPGVDLVKQTYDDIKLKCPTRDVKLLTGSHKCGGSDITVASMDSLHKADYEGTRLILIDEPHSLVTQSRVPIINRFHNARKIGYGATLDGRFDNMDFLIRGIIGPRLAARSYTEAVEEGAVCMIHVIFINVELPLKTYSDRHHAYNGLVFNNPYVHGLINTISKEVIPEDWQTLIFIKHEKQADKLFEKIKTPGTTIAMAKKLTNKERDRVNGLMRDGLIKRCIASDIYSTGVTFSNLRCMINISGGGGNISSIQKPGRLAEIRPGKKAGVVIDFTFSTPNGVDLGRGVSSIIRDSKSRMASYKKKGYTIHKVTTLDEMKNIIEKVS